MKKILINTTLVFFLVLLFFFSAKKAEAAFLKFDKSSLTLNLNELFDLKVMVDAENDQVQSADIYVLYDKTQFEVDSVTTDSSYFGDVTYEKLDGKVYIAGLPEEQGQYQTGSGTVATIKFKALKSGNITFDCDSSGVYKNDPNVPNVLVCSKNGSVTITLAGETPAPTATLTPAPTSPPGNNTYQPTPTALPQTGFFENTLIIAGGGVILLIIGGLFQFIL